MPCRKIRSKCFGRLGGSQNPSRRHMVYWPHPMLLALRTRHLQQVQKFGVALQSPKLREGTSENELQHQQPDPIPHFGAGTGKYIGMKLSTLQSSGIVCGAYNSSSIWEVCADLACQGHKKSNGTHLAVYRAAVHRYLELAAILADQIWRFENVFDVDREAGAGELT